MKQAYYKPEESGYLSPTSVELPMVSEECIAQSPGTAGSYNEDDDFVIDDEF